jgi:hypothetical protein
VSYCRFGPESDLYVVGVGDGYQCINCKLMPSEYASWSGKTRTELFNHLMDHKDCGDKVPLSAITRIAEELSNIPQEHWDNEFNALMRKLATPNGILKEFLQENHAANAKRLAALIEEFVDALCEIDNLDWRED